MAKFTSEWASFEITDDITVEQQLEYVSVTTTFEKKDRLKNLWLGALPLIENWKCKQIKDLEEFDMSMSTDPKDAQILTWVGLQIRIHFDSLDKIPKN